MEMLKRPRRLRGSEVLRKMVRETRMDKASLIYPMFVKEGSGIIEEIPTMPGQFRYSVDTQGEILSRLQDAGVKNVMFFGIPDHKDEVGSGAYDPEGIVQKALRQARKDFPEMYLITDVCMCEYTSHGHCGVLCGHDVDNDRTLELLAKTALSHVEAGADMVAPSDMMDGRVRAIREMLDANGHYTAPIMSYAVKYASGFYGPFRDAAGSAPSFGDRKSYQMDFHNSREGIKEALMDVEEGADIIMVKPAMAYQDMITRVRDAVNVPVAAYSVSGEYAMVKAGASMGTTYAKELKAVGGIEVVEMDTTPLVVQDIKNGRLAAGLFDSSQAAVFVKQNPDLELHVLQGTVVKDDTFAIALPKDSKDVEKINEILKEMRTNGELHKILVAHLGEEGTKEYEAAIEKLDIAKL